MYHFDVYDENRMYVSRLCESSKPNLSLYIYISKSKLFIGKDKIQ